MTRSMSGFNWSKSKAHLLLLSMFLSPRPAQDLTDSNWTDLWRKALKEEPRSAIARFLDGRMIEPAGLCERIAYRYKVAELQAMLRERQLPASGRKIELVGRLVQSHPDDMGKAVAGVTLYTCTSQGRAVAETYRAQQREVRAEVEQQTLDALRGGELRVAVQLVASFDAQQVFPRGISIERQVKIMRIIFEGQPRILASVSQQVLEHLRNAAAMTALWGTNRPGDWLPSDLETGIDLDRDTAARMLIFYAQQQVSLDEYRRSGVVKGVKILTAQDACDSCRKLGEKVYSFDEVPLLPNPDCTHKKGCRCVFVPVTKTYAELGIDAPEPPNF